MSFPDFTAPPLPHPAMDYQVEAFNSHQAEYDGQGRSQLIVMATGLGKSATAAMIARDVVENRGGRVLVLANRDNLIDQLSAEFEYWGLPNAVEKADRRALDLVKINSPSARCVVGSVQTLRGKRLEAWPSDLFDLVIQDEAHYAVASTFRDIYKHFARAKLTGLTATPARDDGRSLGEIFEHVAYEYRLDRAIGDDRLCKLTMVQVNVGIDLRDVKIVGRGDAADLDPQAVADAIGPKVVDIAKAVVLGGKLGPGQTLIFAPCRLSAQALADAFTQLGVPTCSVDYKVPDRREKIAKFCKGTMAEHGEYAALANYGLLTTGFNHKSIGNIVLLRPTKNATLVEQILGRGTRKCALKGECRVIDFDWVVDADKIARPTDLFLPPGASRLVRDAARKAAAGGAIDPAEAVRLAEAAEKQHQDRESAARRAAEKQVRVKVRDNEPVKHKSKSFDLFAVRALTHRPVPAEREGVVRMPATAETVARLKDLGFDSVAGMSQSVAEAELTHWSERKACGMSSLRQIRLLVRNGHDPAKAADLTIREAGQLVSRIQQGWGRKAGGN